MKRERERQEINEEEYESEENEEEDEDYEIDGKDIIVDVEEIRKKSHIKELKMYFVMKHTKR